MTENDKAKKEPKPALRWGLDPDAVLEKLQGRPVRVMLADGKQMICDLVGYNQYWLTVRGAGVVLILNKAHILSIGPGPKTPGEGPEKS